MMLSILFEIRKQYIRLITALTILTLGPYIGFQVFGMAQYEGEIARNVRPIIEISFCILVFALSVVLISYPKCQVRK